VNSLTWTLGGHAKLAEKLYHRQAKFPIRLCLKQIGTFILIAS
jgi:hypothetical protein